MNKITLSEAIRLTLEKHEGIRQTTGELIERDDNGKITGCCALGAAGIGYHDHEGLPICFLTYHLLDVIFPVLQENINLSCYKGNTPEELRDVIIKINDRQKMSLEEIADCLGAAGL